MNTHTTPLATLLCLSFLSLFSLQLACDLGPEEHSVQGEPGHEGGHEADEGHQHEDHHVEVSRGVHLSEDVIREAGIVSTKAKKETISATVQLPGEIVADLDRQARVAARVEGILDSVLVRPGDSVEKGDTLARIRAPNLQALRSAAAALRAKAKSARANAKRVAELSLKRLASEQELVAALAEAEALEAEARGANARLRALGVKGSGGGGLTFTVRTPISGIVVERALVVGAPVGPETIIASIVATDEVWFVGHVFERDVSRVKEGTSAAVRLNAYPEKSFRGTLEYLSHQVDPGSRTLSARIPLTNIDSQLRIGLYGTAHVVIGGSKLAPLLAVPNSAVTSVLGKPTVFVVQPDGGFEAHDVTLGQADTQHTQILHGLHEGEVVVSDGAFTVKSVMLKSTFGEHGH